MKLQKFGAKTKVQLYVDIPQEKLIFKTYFRWNVVEEETISEGC